MKDAQSHITLFNDERYQQCNLRPGQSLFRYDHVAGGRLVGTVSGTVADDRSLLDCGYSAPFGGADVVRPRERVGAITELLHAAAARARAEGIREIRIRARPAYFGPNEAAAEFALLNMGARIEACELSLGLETWRYAAATDYLTALGDSARNMIRQGLRAGLAFAAAQSAEEWADCYRLLAETKRRRGVTMKISLDYLMGLRNLLPQRIIMYRLVKSSRLAAAALVYRVGRDWDYVAAWGDSLDHRSERAMNLLAYCLVRQGIEAGMRVLDLGISSVDGVPDDNLIQFKRSIGGVTGLRLDFRLPLDRCGY